MLAEEYKTGKTVRRALGDVTSSMLSALYEISSSELVLTKVKTRSTVPEPLNQAQVPV